MPKENEIEEFFKKLFDLVPVDYNLFNIVIKIPEENRKAVLLLEKTYPELVIRGPEDDLHITTVGLFTTFSRFFLEDDKTAAILLEEDSDKIAGIKII